MELLPIHSVNILQKDILFLSLTIHVNRCRIFVLMYGGKKGIAHIIIWFKGSREIGLEFISRVGGGEGVFWPRQRR